MAVDTSYRTQVYRERGGARLVVATGGSVSIDGGSIGIATGTAAGTLSIAAGGNVAVAALATVAVSGNVNVAAGGQVSMATGSKRIYPVRTATQSIALSAAESGVTVLNGISEVIYTLPAVATVGKGIVYHIINTAAAVAAATAGGVAFKMRPAAADMIVGVVAGATDSEVINLTATADVEGDGFSVISDGSLGWYAFDIKGTSYTRAAAT